MPVPSNIELVDQHDQKKGRYHFEQFGGRASNRGDLFLKVETGDADDASVSSLAARSTTSSVLKEEDYYLGMEMDMELMIGRRRKKRRAAIFVFLVGVCIVLGSVFAYKKRTSTTNQSANSAPPPNKPAVSTNTTTHDTTTPQTTPQPTHAPPTAPPTPWPTAAPLPAFSMCAPPLVPKDELQQGYSVFHLGSVEIVPEQPSEDSFEDAWEYTFSALDVNHDASMVFVGMSDFSAGTNYSVGLVRAFGFDCTKKEFKQVGQDLQGVNQDEQFGHRLSASADGHVLAVAAPQSSYDGTKNGFVEVYFLSKTSHRWNLLGKRIQDLSDVDGTTDSSDYYYAMLGHAIDLSSKGETLAVLMWTDSDTFSVRVFQYDYNKKDWLRKGQGDVVSTITIADGYDYDPQVKLSNDGDTLSIADPQMGVQFYQFDYINDVWSKDVVKSTNFTTTSSSSTTDDFWIESVDMNDGGSVIAFSAFEEQMTSMNSNMSNVVKVVEYHNNATAGTDVYQQEFADFNVGIQVSVSEDGSTAAIVASREDVDDDNYWFGDVQYVGSMTIVDKNAADGSWSVVGDHTKAQGIGVPGNYVSLSADGQIAAVGSERAVAFYGIKKSGNATGSPADSTSDNATAPAIFSICAPFPNGTVNSHVGDLDKLPREQEEHTVSLAMSKDGSILAVGIDATNDENRGMARVYAWNCDTQQYSQLGQDLFGTSEFDGFGQSVDLSEDGQTLVIGANQPPPGKSGYVEVYKLNDGRWDLLGDRLDKMRDLVEDVGRQVRISDDGSTVLLSGSIVEEFEDGWHDTASFLRVMKYTNGAWQQKGSDLLASIAYDDFGANVRVSLAGDGQTLAVTGSYSPFLAKVYEYNTTKHNWTETIIPPVKTVEAEEETEDDSSFSEYEWDYYFESYFSGDDVALSQNGTVLAIAGTLVTEDTDYVVVRVLTRNATTGNYTLSSDPVDYDDDYAASSIGISGDGRGLVVGINIHSDNSTDQGALYVAALTNSSDYGKVGHVEGRHMGDLLGSRVRISRDGTLAAASSRKGYVSFFKLGG